MLQLLGWRQEDCEVGLSEPGIGRRRSEWFVGGAIHFRGACFMEVLYVAPAS